MQSAAPAVCGRKVLLSRTMLKLLRIMMADSTLLSLVVSMHVLVSSTISAERRRQECCMLTQNASYSHPSHGRVTGSRAVACSLPGVGWSQKVLQILLTSTLNSQCMGYNKLKSSTSRPASEAAAQQGTRGSDTFVSFGIAH